eukprot:scaffold235312_cov29-Tisochrysis_lutea.AAC.1
MQAGVGTNERFLLHFLLASCLAINNHNGNEGQSCHAGFKETYYKTRINEACLPKAPGGRSEQVLRIKLDCHPKQVIKCTV